MTTLTFLVTIGIGRRRLVQERVELYTNVRSCQHTVIFRTSSSLGVSNDLPWELAAQHGWEIGKLTGLYGLPRDATLDGAETLYPEHRKKLKDRFVRPDKCTQNCGAPPPTPPPPARSNSTLPDREVFDRSQVCPLRAGTFIKGRRYGKSVTIATRGCHQEAACESLSDSPWLS
jgi:hypothetical protein